MSDSSQRSTLSSPQKERSVSGASPLPFSSGRHSLKSFSFSVIPPPDIHIDSCGDTSLSFTLTMETDIKVALKFQMAIGRGLAPCGN